MAKSENKNLATQAVALVVGLLVIYVTVRVASKAWKDGK